MKENLLIIRYLDSVSSLPSGESGSTDFGQSRKYTGRRVKENLLTKRYSYGTVRYGY